MTNPVHYQPYRPSVTLPQIRAELEGTRRVEKEVNFVWPWPKDGRLLSRRRSLAWTNSGGCWNGLATVRSGRRCKFFDLLFAFLTRDSLNHLPGVKKLPLLIIEEGTSVLSSG